MLKNMYKTLEFDKILEMLSDNALSQHAKNKIMKLEPYLSEAEVIRHMDETTEARQIIEQLGTPPLSPMTEMDEILSMLKIDALLMPEQLGAVAQFITATRRMKAYLNKAQTQQEKVSCYGYSISDINDVEDEINNAIRGSQVDDRASTALYSIRRKIISVDNQVKDKINALLRNNKQWFSESFISIKNGRFTLPVKREYKNQVSGTVIDVSQSGNTYFIEPSISTRLHDELSLLRIDEENEIRRILYTLSGLVLSKLDLIEQNIEAMEALDFIFAKAKLSLSMKAKQVKVSADRIIKISSGRHPLLKADKVVPLDFSIGEQYRGVVITGPNTGGKTVTLKTVGLLSLMAQSGLHVPVESGQFSMNNYVLSDIGDGQSITENLSTFSSHIANIIEILKHTGRESLVLLDELGSGTDPAEGMGLASAILGELAERNCLFVATTHYPEIKEFAKTTEGMINARMTFDLKSLLPLYQLEIGEAGESCALYIASRLGLPAKLIEKAKAATYGRKSEQVASPSDFNTGTSDRNNTAENATTSGVTEKRIIRQEPVKPASESTASIKFNIGDSVMIYPQKEIGIVYQKANEKGEVGIQIKKEKKLINHKRLKLHVAATELYPPDYDFSVIFDSVSTRKARKKMTKHHDENLVLVFNEGDER